MDKVPDLSQYYDMKNVFDETNFPDENYLMEQMDKGTERNFPEVINGEQKSLIMLPDNVFHYGKGKDQVVIHIQQILDKIKELEKQTELDETKDPSPISLTEKKRRELNALEKDHMKNLAKGLLTEQGEGDVYHRFQEHLHDELGFL